jgi:hypothetical protein
MLDQIIITFRDNNNGHIVSSTRVSQYWHDLKAEVVPESKLEIAIPIGIFLKMKDDRMFQSHFVDVVRLRTTPKSILGSLAYPINGFDNTLDDDKFKEILKLKYN